MDLLFNSVCFVLAVLFVWAGVAKLRDRAMTVNMLHDFGLPRRWPTPVSRVLPWSEIAIGVFLLPAATRHPASIAAVTMLLAFTSLLVVNLALGKHPPCSCFGQEKGSPISWATVVRNLALSATAAGIAMQDDPLARAIFDQLSSAGEIGLSRLSWAAFLGVFNFLLLVLIAFAVLQVVKQQGRLLAKISTFEPAPPLNSQGMAAKHGSVVAESPRTEYPAMTRRVPEFALTDAQGHKIPSKNLFHKGLPSLVVFVNPDCGPCEAFLPTLLAWKEREPKLAYVLVATEGGVPAAQKPAALPAGVDVFWQAEREVTKAFDIGGTPAAVLIAPGADKMTDSALGPAAIERLMATLSTVGRPADRALALRLTSASGAPVDLAHWRSKRTLLLFWNPLCGFCQQMEGTVKYLSVHGTGAFDAFALVAASASAAHEILPLHSEVIIDEGGALASLAKMRGTPAAAVLSADGHLSPAVHGAAEIGQLLDADAAGTARAHLHTRTPALARPY